MTTSQHPGGVAGRVIRECEDERYGGLIANGAYRMRDEMSREARAILAELETHRERQEHPDFYAVASDLLRNTRAFFIRLGLDLESEDTE